jgi:hypothetical protein
MNHVTSIPSVVPLESFGIWFTNATEVCIQMGLLFWQVLLDLILFIPPACVVLVIDDIHSWASSWRRSE